MTHEIYIGYAPRDKTAANAVRAVLESEGLTCWIASRDLAAGANPAEAMGGAINTAKIFVLIFSANTNAAEDQIVREVGQAAERAVPIIGFRTANVAPGDTLKHFLKTHWIDAFVPPLDTHMRELSSLILGLLGRRAGFMPALKAFVPSGAPALKGVVAVAKTFPGKLPSLQIKLEPRVPKLALLAIDNGAIVRKLRMPLIITLSMSLLAGAAAGAWIILRPHATPQDAQAWQTASQADSLPAYQNYLLQFPQGYYHEQVISRISNLKNETEAAFTKAKASGTAAAYRNFLDSYSRQGLDIAAAKSDFAAADAREKAEHAAFADASRTRTRAVYQTFLDQYGASADAAEVRKRIATCRSESRTVTDKQERTLSRSATGSGTSESGACSSARGSATDTIEAVCSEGKGSLGAIQIVNETPQNDPSVSSRRSVGSFLGSLFNRGRSLDLGGSYRCTTEVSARCSTPVTATRQVDVCP